MDFEWDPEKARLNETKHGASFVEGSEVFDDDFSSCVQDPDHSQEDERYLLFGQSHQGRFLVVSYTERSEIIRIISVRQMTPRERKAYEQ
jgi:uncharacterized DUF497 family protein